MARLRLAISKQSAGAGEYQHARNAGHCQGRDLGQPGVPQIVRVARSGRRPPARRRCCPRWQAAALGLRVAPRSHREPVPRATPVRRRDPPPPGTGGRSHDDRQCDRRDREFARPPCARRRGSTAIDGRSAVAVGRLHASAAGPDGRAAPRCRRRRHRRGCRQAAVRVVAGSDGQVWPPPVRSLDVVSLDVVPLAVVWLDVVCDRTSTQLVVVGDCRCRVVSATPSVVVFVVDGGVTLGGLDSELSPPQCCAFPLPVVVAAVAVGRIPAVTAACRRRWRRYRPGCRCRVLPPSPVPAPEPPLPFGSPSDPACPARQSNAFRRESAVEAEGSAMAMRRPGHPGTARGPQRRPPRRDAHANPRRHHPSRRHRRGSPIRNSCTIAYCLLEQYFAPGHTEPQQMFRTIVLGCTITDSSCIVNEMTGRQPGWACSSAKPAPPAGRGPRHQGQGKTRGQARREERRPSHQGRPQSRNQGAEGATQERSATATRPRSRLPRLS